MTKKKSIVILSIAIVILSEAKDLFASPNPTSSSLMRLFGKSSDNRSCDDIGGQGPKTGQAAFVFWMDSVGQDYQSGFGLHVD